MSIREQDYMTTWHRKYNYITEKYTAGEKHKPKKHTYINYRVGLTKCHSLGLQFVTTFSPLLSPRNSVGGDIVMRPFVCG